jgi:hypothetical protein
MTLKHPTFGHLYAFIESNTGTPKADGFKLVDEFCANHSLDPVTLKEVLFYFGANTDGEVLSRVKGHILGKAILRPWGHHANKMARS